MPLVGLSEYCTPITVARPLLGPERLSVWMVGVVVLGALDGLAVGV